MPFLNFVSGLLVFFIGVTLFKSRVLPLLGYKKSVEDLDDPAHNVEDLDNNFTHTHGGSTHSHLPPKKVTWKNLLALGISGGLLPCPSALVLMLAAISKERIGYGLILTFVFSLGLATTLTVIGLAFLYGGRFFDNPTLSENKFVKALPALQRIRHRLRRRGDLLSINSLNLKSMFVFVETMQMFVRVNYAVRMRVMMSVNQIRAFQKLSVG